MTKRTNQSPARPNSAATSLGGVRFSPKMLCRRGMGNRAVSLFLSGRGLLPAMFLFATVLMGTTVAQGHELGLSDATSVSSPSNGWWSPETVDSYGTSHRQLRLNRGTSETFGSLLSVELKPVSSSAADVHPGANYANGNVLSALGSDPETSGPASMLDDSSKETRFFRYQVEAEYLLWQSRLMDSETLTAERGVLVYPFAQVNLIDARVPISLYIPRLRGSAPNTAW